MSTNVKLTARPSDYTDTGPKTGDVLQTAGALHVHMATELQGEDSAFDMVWGGGRCRPVSLTADGQVGAASAGYYCGYTVTTATATDIITVRNAVSAGTGTIVDLIPTSTAAGTTKMFAHAVYCATGIYADFTGTGTVTFYYWQG